MFLNLWSFLRSEDGAVTIDWVVITAGVVGLATVTMTSIQGGNDSVATGVSDYVAAVPVESGL